MLYIKKMLPFFIGVLIFFSYKLSFAEETYDPFADYSEFAIIKEEEQDVNFFNDGRFLSLGILVQRAQPIGDLAEVYGGAFGVHFIVSYFFDLRFALQVNFGYQDHKYVTTEESFNGSAQFRDLGIGIKYYVNPERIVYSLSQFNPYVLVGTSLVTETREIATSSDTAEVSHTVYNFGLGFELPIPGKKFFVSGQVVYNFSSSFGQENLLGNKSGDFISTGLNVGINF
ncbi:MAG: hypothetical protein HAW63_02485 [Bdellovibrionaceae bacterium]|nr:hypothetical protein [Pseudobdellovibrionaceae bacterium]